VLVVVVVVEGGDKLERIVVVIGPREKKSFTGKNLEAIDHSEAGTDAVKLIIKERGEKDEIAVFRHWRYWYQTKEEKVVSNQRGKGR